MNEFFAKISAAYQWTKRVIGTLVSPALAVVNFSIKVFNVIYFYSSKITASVITFVSKTLGEIIIAPAIFLITRDDIYLKSQGERFAENTYGKSDNNLLSGKLREAALEKYPPNRFPELWMHIPADLDRPLVQDGELPDGSLPHETLGPATVTNEGMSVASTKALKSAAVIVSLLLIPLALFLYGIWTSLDLGNFKVYPSPDNIFLDGSLPSAHLKTSFIDVFQAVFKVAVAALLGIITIGLMMMKLGVSLWLKGLSAIVNSAISEAVADISLPNKESIVRRNWRLLQVKDERSAWIQQVKDVSETGWDRTPTIEVGVSTGHFQFVGALNAPSEGQSVAMSIQDLMQHLLLLGGTGSGKTRKMITPIVRQLAEISRNSSNRVSFYITDAKSVLWRDLSPTFKAAGIETRVIGVEEGMFNVSLFEGLAPEEVVDMLISAAIQVFGGTREFWTNSAGKRAYVVLMIARAWRITDDGIAWADERNEDPYSIAGLNAMATSPSTMKRAVDAVLEDLAKTQRVLKAGFFNVQLEDAINSDIEEWALMAEEQKSGVLGTLSHLLSDFLRNPKLRAGFASGRVDHNTVSIKDLWDGKATMICLPPNSLGTAALITNVFLKTRLYKEAREREERSRNSDKSMKKWTDDPEYLYFIADEFQSLVTCGGQNSDSDFWNVSRSARVSGIIATQSISAIEAKIGRDQTTNFVNEMRSRIFGASECEKTIGFMSFLAGKTMRSMTFTREADESLNSRFLNAAKRGNELSLTAPTFRPENVTYWGPFTAALNIFTGVKDRFAVRSKRFEVDNSYISGKGAEVSAQKKQALWRAEDKHDAWMSQGNSETLSLNPSDLMDLGSGYAFVSVMRAGRARRAVVQLPN